MTRTAHQQRVVEFMLRAKQDVPMVPAVPSDKVRILRAKLILEEALETIEALGISIRTKESWDNRHHDEPSTVGISMDDLTWHADGDANLAEIADGCADISVVTTGTLIACGIHDQEVLEAVDANNLAKFGPGHSWRDDGKLIKPPGHTKVDMATVLAFQAPGSFKIQPGGVGSLKAAP